MVGDVTVKIMGANCSTKNFEYVRRAFWRMEDVYGKMDCELRACERGRDRECVVVNVNEMAIGVLVVMRVPSDEYDGYGAGNSLEIKRVCWLREEGPGKEVERRVFEKMTRKARKVGAWGMHIVIAEGQGAEVETLERNGFVPMARRSRDEINERLYFRRIAETRPKRRRENGAARAEKRERRGSQRHEIRIEDALLRSIESERKTKEARFTENGEVKYQVGDMLCFRSKKKEAVTCRLIGVNAYPTAREMLENEGVEPFFPEENSVEDALRLHFRLPLLLGGAVEVVALTFVKVS